jgi:hypothetical protein
MRVLGVPRKFESFYAFKQFRSAFAPKYKTNEICINLYRNPLCTIVPMYHLAHTPMVAEVGGVLGTLTYPYRILPYSAYYDHRAAHDGGPWCSYIVCWCNKKYLNAQLDLLLLPNVTHYGLSWRLGP